MKVPCRQLPVRTASSTEAHEGNDVCIARGSMPRLPDGRDVHCGRSDRGGKQAWRPEHQQMAAVAKSPSALKSLSGYLRDADLSPRREGRCRWGSNGQAHSADRRDRGPGIQGRIHGDNVGKDRLAAGTGDNLRRPTRRGQGRRRWEGDGLAHEPIGAMTKGQRPSTRRTTSCRNG